MFSSLDPGGGVNPPKYNFSHEEIDTTCCASGVEVTEVYKDYPGYNKKNFRANEIKSL